MKPASQRLRLEPDRRVVTPGSSLFSMSNRSVIETQVLSWEGITAHPHRFGGHEYRLGSREI
ncbi:MAG: hypothetical protein HC933_01330, partial [Pleurocapsa sp. SU_196_0]|nr:hypothetical protein [Pleurocapsa sp. SU_196_0]